MPRRLHLPSPSGAPLCSRQLSKLTPTSQGNSTMRVAATAEDEAKARVESRICRHCLRTGAELPPVGAEPPSGLSLEGDDELEEEDEG